MTEQTNVYCTGLAEGEDICDIEEIEQCYLCKRSTGDKSIAVLNCGRVTSPEITLKVFDRNVDGMGFSFPLCQECIILLDL